MEDFFNKRDKPPEGGLSELAEILIDPPLFRVEGDIHFLIAYQFVEAILQYIGNDTVGKVIININADITPFKKIIVNAIDNIFGGNKVLLFHDNYLPHVVFKNSIG